ncbi:hypothetical protein COCOBI_03-0330 [Coccomyxa sp. Obi]|nr:hypothetical protein COCOBI_03-0330 [Coccomyxa sp. Obi]
MTSVYNTCKIVVPQKGVQKLSRQVVRKRPSAAITCLRSNKEDVYQPKATSGGGGGGCHTGPPPRKLTDDEEPNRPAARKEATKLTAKDLVRLLCSLVMGLGLVSLGQGPGWQAPPLNHVLNRAVNTADHVTVHRKETRLVFSYMMGAFVAAASVPRKKDGGSTTVDRVLAGMGAATAVVLYSAIKSKDA